MAYRAELARGGLIRELGKSFGVEMREIPEEVPNEGRRRFIASLAASLAGIGAIGLIAFWRKEEDQKPIEPKLSPEKLTQVTRLRTFLEDYIVLPPGVKSFLNNLPTLSDDELKYELLIERHDGAYSRGTTFHQWRKLTDTGPRPTGWSVIINDTSAKIPPGLLGEVRSLLDADGEMVGAYQQITAKELIKPDRLQDVAARVLRDKNYQWKLTTSKNDPRFVNAELWGIGHAEDKRIEVRVRSNGYFSLQVFQDYPEI